MKIKLTCPYCGSDELRKDAYASWDVEAQEWVLHSTYDDVVCDNCGQNVREANEEEVSA